MALIPADFLHAAAIHCDSIVRFETSFSAHRSSTVDFIAPG